MFLAPLYPRLFHALYAAHPIASGDFRNLLLARLCDHRNFRRGRSHESRGPFLGARCSRHPDLLGLVPQFLRKCGLQIRGRSPPRFSHSGEVGVGREKLVIMMLLHIPIPYVAIKFPSGRTDGRTRCTPESRSRPEATSGSNLRPEGWTDGASPSRPEGLDAPLLNSETDMSNTESDLKIMRRTELKTPPQTGTSVLLVVPARLEGGMGCVGVPKMGSQHQDGVSSPRSFRSQDDSSSHHHQFAPPQVGVLQPDRGRRRANKNRAGRQAMRSGGLAACAVRFLHVELQLGMFFFFACFSGARGGPY